MAKNIVYRVQCWFETREFRVTPMGPFVNTCTDRVGASLSGYYTLVSAPDKETALRIGKERIELYLPDEATIESFSKPPRKPRVPKPKKAAITKRQLIIFKGKEL